jgi:hypothetical protein
MFNITNRLAISFELLRRKRRHIMPIWLTRLICHRFFELVHETRHRKYLVEPNLDTGHPQLHQMLNLEVYIRQIARVSLMPAGA